MLTQDGTLVGPPVQVDFNDMASGMVPLDMPGTLEDLRAHRLSLREGLALVLYSYDATDTFHPDDLLAVGVATFDLDRQRWLAQVEQDSFTHESDLDSETMALLSAARANLQRPS
jgi:hypothetical protein